eukprot:2652568-Alexandrium_andersonii.AAC.1
MSASLVGSEMCIRDRRLMVVQPLAVEDEHDIGELYVPWEVRRALEEVWTCLLYTSDAADDM